MLFSYEERGSDGQSWNKFGRWLGWDRCFSQPRVCHTKTYRPNCMDMVVDNKPTLDFNDSYMCDSVFVYLCPDSARRTKTLKGKNNQSLKQAERNRLIFGEA